MDTEKMSDHFKKARTEYNQYGEQSPAAVYEATGISDSTIYGIEHGSRTPRADVVVILAKHYGVPADYLLGLTDDHHHTTSAVDELGLPEKAIAQLKDIKKWADNEQDPETYFRKRFELLRTLLSDKRFEDFLNYFANIYWAAEETRTERKKKEAGEGHGYASAKHGYKYEKYLCLEKFGKLLVSVCHTEDLED